MKKMLLFLVVLIVISCKSVYARKIEPVLTIEKKSINIGLITEVYLSFSESSIISYLDFSYNIDNCMKLEAVSYDKGLNALAKNNSRIVMYSINGIDSSKKLVTLNVIGNKSGISNIKIENLRAIIDGKLITIDNINITVEVLDKKEGKQELVVEANRLVELAEKEETLDNVEIAVSKVENLEQGAIKLELSSRLDKIKKDLKFISNNVGEVCSGSEYKKDWLNISIILLIVLISETIYILINKNKVQQ